MRKDDAWGSSNKSSNWGDVDRFESKQSSMLIEDIPHKEPEDRGRSRNKSYETSGGVDAQKKFGNAKAISSDQFFGQRDPDVSNL